MVIAVALAVTGCKKDDHAGGRAALPAELARPRPAGAPAALPSPALLAHVPADTPYVMASLVPVPAALWGKIKAAVGDRLGVALRAAVAGGSDDTAGAVMTAVMAELEGKGDAAGLASLGLTATPNYVIYGLGLAPMVVRVDIADENVLLATLERVARRAQLTLPAPAELAGRRYWRLEPGDDASLIISIAARQLVIAMGPTTAVDSQLALILGSQLPPASLGTSRGLQAAYGAHGFGPHFLGYLDVRRMLEEAIALVGAPSSGCRSETAALAGRLPRVVMGYELGASRMTGGAVLELAPDVRAKVAGLRRAVPGLEPVMANTPLLAIGVGLDLERGRLLARDAAEAVATLGGACDLRELTSVTDDLIRGLAQPLPPVVAGIAGGAVAIYDLVLGDALMPKQVDALGLLAADKPAALLEMLAQGLPISVPADGKLHPIAVPGVQLPGELVGGIGAKALVLAMGARARTVATTALTAPAGGTAPLLAMAYDYGRVLALQAAFGRLVGRLGGEDTTASDAEASLNEGLAALYGRASFAADVTDKGVVMWGTIELK